MRSIRAALMMALLLLLSQPSIVLAAEDGLRSIAVIDEIGSIEDNAIGLSSAVLRPQGNQLLLVGDDGYVHLIDAEEPGSRSKDVSLTSGKEIDLNAASWHPQGQTALIVGDAGMVLRLVMDNHAIETVDGFGALEGERQNAVQWNRNGDVAYLGGDNGSLYRYSSAEGFDLMTTSRSPVTAIDCHYSPSTRLCVLTTAGDGVAVIDSYHQVHWVSNTAADTWVDVVCPSLTMDVCIIIGSGKRIALLQLDVEDPASSFIDSPEVLSTLAGELTGGSLMGDGSVSLHVAPYSIATYDLDERMAWVVVQSDDVQDLGSLRGSALIHVWGSDDDTGFLLSSSGALGEMEPLLEAHESDLMSMAVIVLVAISVPGVVFGMIYMNSKTLQRWWNGRARRRRQKKAERLTAKAAAKDKSRH